jgi:hypothetical protein
MKTKFITAFYTDLKGFPFFCHENPAREERYLHSLRVLNNMNTELICYCNDTQESFLRSYMQEFALNNVILKISNLKDFKFAARMQKIKADTANFQFYHEVDWNKIYLLEKEYDHQYDYIYWIDVGLSHHGLFPNKYNPNAHLATGYSKDFETYSFTDLFNSVLVEKLNKFSDTKLINIQNAQQWHNTRDLNRILNLNFIYQGLSTGGILGGHTSKLQWFINTFDNWAHKSLDTNFILNHEAIISAIYESHPENFSNFLFQTWYHVDYPGLDDFSKEHLIHYSDFFDMVLKN